MKKSHMKLQGWQIAIILVFALGGLAAGQTQKSKQDPKPSVNRQNFSLRISTKNVLSVSLKAENASLADVAAELSKRLEIPVILGESRAKHEVTTHFKGLLLEPAMQLLAPEVYIDYEINTASRERIRPVGIYLNGYGDLQPAINVVIPSKSDAVLVEGDTEEGPEDSPSAAENENPVRVFYEGYMLTVKARQQPLMVVLAKIAVELGIPLELKAESNEVVDVDIKKMSPEDVVQRLSPNVRLYIRADLRRLQRRPFRMILVAADKASY